MTAPISTHAGSCTPAEKVENQSLILHPDALEKLYDKPIDVVYNKQHLGKITFGDFIKELQRQFQLVFGNDFRLDLVGGAVVQTYNQAGFLQDIDISIELPLKYTPQLEQVSSIIQKALAKVGIKIPKGNLKAPFFRRSIILYEKFSGVILSFGDDNFWVDVTVTTINERSFLFRFQDIKASLKPFNTYQEAAKLESISTTPEVALNDRREGRVVIDYPRQVNHQGWPNLILLLAKGKILESKSAEPILKTTFLAYSKSGAASALQLLNNVFDNHGSPAVRGRFYLLAFLALLNDVEAKLLKLISEECKRHVSPEALFLQFAGSFCVSDPIKRALLPIIAYVHDLIPWPGLDLNDWYTFLRGLNSLTWWEKALPAPFNIPLKNRVFEKILSLPNNAAELSKKKSLDHFFTSLTQEELPDYLPRRLQYEETLSPDLAVHTANKYIDLLTLETKSWLLNALLARKNSLFLHQFLDNEWKHNPEKVLHLLQNCKNPEKVTSFIEQCIQKATCENELKALFEYIKGTAPNLALQLHRKYKELAISPTLEETLVLYRGEDRPLTDEELKDLISLLSESRLKKPSDSLKKDIIYIWKPLFSKAKEAEKIALLTLVKRWQLTFEEPILNNQDIGTLSETVLAAIFDESSFVIEDRKSCILERLRRLNEAKEHAIELTLYRETAYFWKNSNRRELLFEELKNPSPLTLLLFMSDIPIPTVPLEPLFSLLNETKEKISFIDRSFERGLLNIDHLKWVVDLQGCDKNKLLWSSAFDYSSKLKILATIDPKALTSSENMELFIQLLRSIEEKTLGYIKKIADHVPNSFIFSQIPAIVLHVAHLNIDERNSELTFWLNRMNLSSWLKYPADKRQMLLLLTDNQSQFFPIYIALLIGSEKESDVLHAFKELQMSSTPSFTELALLLLKRMASIEKMPPEEDLRAFLLKLETIALETSGFFSFRHQLQDAIESGESNLYLRAYCISAIGCPNPTIPWEKISRKYRLLLDRERFDFLFQIIETLPAFEQKIPEYLLSQISKTVTQFLVSLKQKKMNLVTMNIIHPMIKAVFLCHATDKSALQLKLAQWIEEIISWAILQNNSDVTFFKKAIHQFLYEANYYLHALTEGAPAFEIAHISVDRLFSNPYNRSELDQSGNKILEFIKVRLCNSLFESARDLPVNNLLFQTVLNEAIHLLRTEVNQPNPSFVRNFRFFFDHVQERSENFEAPFFPLLQALVASPKCKEHFYDDPVTLVKALIYAYHNLENFEEKETLLFMGISHVIELSDKLCSREEWLKLTSRLISNHYIFFKPLPNDIALIERHFARIQEILEKINKRNIMLVASSHEIASKFFSSNMSSATFKASMLFACIPKSLNIPFDELVEEGLFLSFEYLVKLNSPYTTREKGFSLMQFLLKSSELKSQIRLSGLLHFWTFLKRLKSDPAYLFYQRSFMDAVHKTLFDSKEDFSEFYYGLLKLQGDIILDLISEEPTDQAIESVLLQFYLMIDSGFYKGKGVVYFEEHALSFGARIYRRFTSQDPEIHPYLKLLSHFALMQPEQQTMIAQLTSKCIDQLAPKQE